MTAIIYRLFQQSGHLTHAPSTPKVCGCQNYSLRYQRLHRPSEYGSTTTPTED